VRLVSLAVISCILLAATPVGAQVEVSLLRDVRPGAESSAPWRVGALGDTLLFMADSSGAGGPEIWGTDGSATWHVFTPPDTTMGQPRVLGRLGDQLYFLIGGALWRTDGVAADTVRTGVTSQRFFTPCAGRVPAAVLADRIVFAAGGGCDLWAASADSSWSVATPVVEGGPGPAVAQHLFALGGQAYVFWGFDAVVGRSIYRTSGAPGHHESALDPEPNQSPRGWDAAFLWEGALYFASDRGATGEEMWRWTGAGAPTLVGDLVPGAGGSMPRSPFAALGRLFFLASTQDTGRELRAWDGTSLITPFEVAPGGGPAANVSQVGHREAAGVLYFWVRTGTNGSDTFALHSWDGTTHNVVTTGLGNDAFHEAGHVVGAGGRAWFDGCDLAGAHGASLWHTDGVTASVAVAGSPDVCTGARPFMAMAEADGWLLARMDDPAVGIEPFMVRFTGSVATQDAPAGGAPTLRVAPNPVVGAGAVTLTLAAPAPAANVTVHDVLGREVAVLHAGALPAGATRFALVAGVLPAGVYVVRAVAPAGVSATRFVVTGR